MAQKRIVDLTQGGTCDACDDKHECCVCHALGNDVMLYYAMSGDHDHLIMREGQLGREAHGQIMCMEHYKADWQKFYPEEKWPTDQDTKTQAQ